MITATFQVISAVFSSIAAVVIACVLSVYGPSAKADSWNFPPTIQKDRTTFGDVTITRMRDARKNQKYPRYSVEITRRGTLLARIPGIYYEKLFPAPDGSFFVGLSNDGLSGTAVVVLDREGELKLMVRHGPATFDYCERSITLRRVWFDEVEPKVTFIKDSQFDGYTVKVKTCKGVEVNLMAEIRSAYDRSSQQIRSNIR